MTSDIPFWDMAVTMYLIEAIMKECKPAPFFHNPKHIVICEECKYTIHQHMTYAKYKGRNLCVSCYNKISQT